MKDYQRSYPLFSLCGLNCGLCPMHLNHYCPGCGGGEGHQPCAFIRCSLQHGKVEYCFLCDEYPCDRYRGVTDYDSFITHQHMHKDLEKAKKIGPDAYQAQLNEKIRILQNLLDNYNDGRRKSFFCLAVTLLDLDDIKCVMEQLAAKENPAAPIKEKAVLAVNLFQAMAQKRHIRLKLNRKPKGKRSSAGSD